MQQTLRDAVAFCARNRPLVLWVMLAAVISYGFVICNFSLSIDEEVQFTNDATFAWTEQGRWAITLLKLVFGTRLPLPFFQPALAVFLLGCAGIAWCFVFVSVTGRKLEGSRWLTLFAVLYVTMPCNAYYLSFNTYNAEVSVGLVLTAMFGLTTFNWAFARAGWPSFIAATLLLMFSIAIYQSLLVVGAAGIAAIVLLHILSLPAEARNSTAETIRSFAYCGAPLVAGYLCYVVVTTILVSHQLYVENFFNWGKLDSIFIARWLLNYIGAFFLGKGFIGGQVVYPLTAIAFVGAWLLSWNAAKRRDYLPLLLYFMLLVSPFVLSIGLGTPMPNRTQQALPLAYAALTLVVPLLLGWESRGNAVITFATLLVITWNGQINTRLSFSEYFAFKRDEVVARQLADRLFAKGWDGRPAPLVVTPGYSYSANRYLFKTETIGASFFEWDNGARAPLFLSMLGYRLYNPTPTQKVIGLQIAATLPKWPRQGSVVFVDGVAIVNMGTSSNPQ